MGWGPYGLGAVSPGRAVTASAVSMTTTSAVSITTTSSVPMATTSAAPSSSILKMPGAVIAAIPALSGFLFAAVKGNFDFHGPPEQLLAVQLVYCPQGVILRFHGYKTKSTGISRRAIRNEDGLQYRPGTGKKIAYVLLGSRVVQIPDIEFILHF